jgi:hypothetical protein
MGDSMGDRSREIAWEIAWEIGLGVERLDCNLHGGLMAGATGLERTGQSSP